MKKVNWIKNYLIDVYDEEHQSFLPYYDNPKTDNEKLMNLQKYWYTTGSEDAWSQMWSYSLFVAKKFARFYYKQRKLSFTDEDVHDKAIEAVEYVLKRFRLNNYYYIEKNFSSQLFLGVKHAFDYTFQTKNGRLYEMAENICLEDNINFQTALEVAKEQIEKEEKEKKGKKKEVIKETEGQLFLFG